MQRNYARKDKQAEIDKEKSAHDDAVVQEFRDQFDNDRRTIKDVEDFEAKYGINLEEYQIIRCNV